ncbi:MAG: hypothetical protein WBS24_00475 [Terriglobales bacterium]
MQKLFFYIAILISILPFHAVAQDSEKQAQSSEPESSNQSAQSSSSVANMAGMDMDTHMNMNMPHSTPAWVPSPHLSSGTGWQPAATTGEAWMKSLGSWGLMAHGVVFVDYNQQGGPRGEGKAESVNWLMLMQQHSLAGGTLLFREMFSAESLTAPHPGFPELFQTGETYHGQALVDHQHPHNVFGELALDYTHAIGDRISWLLYGGPVAEPALGPVAYIHRASAAELPLAPLSHHLQDSTHISFGVITTGLVFERFKIEGSAFNGREPNEKRYTIQLAPLDSWSARISVAPTRNWTMQYSYGRLEHPEALEPGSQRRQTASVEYFRPLWGGPLSHGSWASSLVWGRVHDVFDNHNLNGYLLESTLNFKSSYYLFSRLELLDKDELFPDDPLLPSYRVGAYTLGADRDILKRKVGQLAMGADVTFYSKPSSLNAAYGNNPVSFQIFLRLRPSGPGHKH